MVVVHSERKLWLLATAMVAAGLLISLFGGEHGRAPGDALLIAGLLAVTVDRYVKLRLREDIAHDVFFAALGIHLPDKLKEEILAIGDCRLVRREMQVNYKLTPLTTEPLVLCETEVSFGMENLTHQLQEYTHRVWVGNPPAGVQHPPQSISFVKAQLPRGDGYEYCGAQILAIEQELGHFWEESVKIPPRATAQFWSTTRQLLPLEYEDTCILTQPTIGVTVRVECPKELEHTVTFGHRLRTATEELPYNTWRLNAAFFPHSPFRVTWRRAAVIEAPVDITPRLQIRTGQAQPPAHDAG